MKIGIIGTGAYGLALATILEENKNQVTLWTKFEKEKELLETTRMYEKVLPGVTFSKNLKFTIDIKDCIENNEMIVWAIPAEFIVETLKECKNFFNENQIVVIATKGIDSHSGDFLHDIIKKEIDTKKIAIISGPSFAIDITAKKPIGLSLATESDKVSSTIKQAFENKHFRLRTNDDLIGTAICGSIKNVIAIAAGMLHGLGANESTKAMFITEALNDIKEFIKESGGDKNTILTFAGFGDLLLTATSEKSRNYSFGEILSHPNKKKREEYLKNNTVEGMYTLDAIYKKMEKENLSMPIIHLIYDIIYLNREPEHIYDFLIEKK